MSDEHELDLPHEEIPDGPVDQEIESFFAGGIVIRSAVLQTERGPMPALVFDFHLVDGETLPSITLVQVDEQMTKFAALAQSATHAAIRGARRARR